MTSKTLASIDAAIENRRIVWTCIFEAAGKQGGMKHNFPTITDFTLLHVLSRTSK